MTKVVFQDRGYWLRDDFWQETQDAGLEAIAVELKNRVLTTRPITRDEFAAQFSGRVANWVISADKSVSVFGEASAPNQQTKVNEFFLEAIQVGLDAVAREFTARTGAQGKVRLPAEASFVVVIHTRAKDGSPQIHAHIAIGDRVCVQGQAATYATHKRELYQLRKLFSATTFHHFGHRLQSELGVRVQKKDQGIILPDVPKPLCQRASVRTKQIDDYIKRHNLKNTPLTRKYAAIVTRRENRDPMRGRNVFREEVARTGFKSEQIINRVPRNQHVDPTGRSGVMERHRIGLLGRRLSKSHGSLKHNQLLTRALETAELHHPVSRIKSGTETVNIHRRKNGLDRTDKVTKETVKQWKKVVRKIDYILKSKKLNQSKTKSNQQRTNQDSAKADGARTSQHSTRQEKNESNKHSERSTNFNRVVEKVLRSHQVIGAVGRVGVKAVEIAIELYQTWAKPIWRVHGNGHKNMPGSVAKMVRDLKPLKMLESHKVALIAMRKLNGTLEQKLLYGQYVYRQCRKPKFRIPRKSLIVVRDAWMANPKDLNFILTKAGRAKAKTILVDQEYSRSQLMKAAKTMKPGEHRRFHEQEIKR